MRRRWRQMTQWWWRVEMFEKALKWSHFLWLPQQSLLQTADSSSLPFLIHLHLQIQSEHTRTLSVSFHLSLLHSTVHIYIMLLWHGWMVLKCFYGYKNKLVLSESCKCFYFKMKTERDERVEEHSHCWKKWH